MRKSFLQPKKHIKLQFDIQVKRICAVFVTSQPFYGDIITEVEFVTHMGSEYVSREKKLSMVNFLIFVQKNMSTIRFQEIKIRPFGGFEKMRFLCFYIIGV